MQTSPSFVLQVVPLFKICVRLHPGREAELQFLHESLRFGGLHILWVAFIKIHMFWYPCAPPACSMNVPISPVPGSPAMSSACCWMPGLPRCAWCLPAAASAQPQIARASAPVTLLCLFIRAQDSLLLETDCSGDSQVFKEASYALHRLLLSAIFWCLPCHEKEGFFLDWELFEEKGAFS